MRGGADTGEHQQLRRIDRGRRQNDFLARANPFDLVSALNFHSGCAPVLDDDAAHETVHQPQIWTFQCRTQIGVGGGPAATLPDRLLHRAETFLFQTVIIGRRFETGLLAGGHEGIEERIRLFAARNMQRPVRAPALALGTPVARFCALEIRLHIGVGPPVGTALLPMVEILGMPAHIDHAVDRRRPADDLAARRCHLAIIEVRLRLRAVSPVVARHVHRVGQAPPASE